MIPKKSSLRVMEGWPGKKVWLAGWIISLVVMFVAGVTAGSWFVETQAQPAEITRWQASATEIQHKLDRVTADRDWLALEKTVSDDNIDWLTRKVGKLEAHILRIEALGLRLSELANLDENEFDFGNEVAQGGPLETSPEDEALFGSLQLAFAPLTNLSDQVDRYSSQLEFIESFMIQNQVTGGSTLSGWPVESGWISSRFGSRTDPFTGKRAFHSGLDIANKRGTEIYALADGIVTWSGTMSAYGQMIEVDHGTGYHTRYAHAHSLLVKVGDRVKKGQLIALMGATGRASGPHLHFEVRHNGKAQDPLNYIKRDS